MKKMSKITQLSLFSDEDFNDNKPPYVEDKGDDRHFVGDNNMIFNKRLRQLKSFGKNINDLPKIAKECDFPDYMISVYKYLDDKQLYLNDYKSYKYIHDTLDNMWQRRELRVAKSPDGEPFYRTVFQTVLDIGTDALLTYFLKKSIEDLSVYNIHINKRDDNFELLKHASLEPDFYFGKTGMLEMKISGDRKYGLKNNDTKFQINPRNLNDELYRYEKYYNSTDKSFYFLRIDANTNKLIVIAYDEFDSNGHVNLKPNRVKTFYGLNDFGKKLDEAIKETIKTLYNRDGTRKNN